MRAWQLPSGSLVMHTRGRSRLRVPLRCVSYPPVLRVALVGCMPVPFASFPLSSHAGCLFGMAVRARLGPSAAREGEGRGGARAMLWARSLLVGSPASCMRCSRSCCPLRGRLTPPSAPLTSAPGSCAHAKSRSRRRPRQGFRWMCNLRKVCVEAQRGEFVCACALPALLFPSGLQARPVSI